jgi:hypothetical protein
VYLYITPCRFQDVHRFLFCSKSIFFKNYTVQHRRTLTSINIRTLTIFLWAPPKDWANRSWDSRSHHRCLAIDGDDIAYHWKHSANKSWNKSRNMRAPVPSCGLKHGGHVPPQETQPADLWSSKSNFFNIDLDHRKIYKHRQPHYMLIKSTMKYTCPWNSVYLAYKC